MPVAIARPSIRTNDETERLLFLLTNRNTGVLHGALRASPQFRDGYLSTVSTSTEDRDLIARLGELLTIACNDDSFLLSLATVLPPTVGTLFWVHLIDRLVAEQRCNLQHFGTVTTTVVGGRIVVSYESSLDLIKQEHDPLEPRNEAAWVASRIAHEQLQAIKQSLLPVPFERGLATLNATTSQVMVRTLPTTVRTILRDQGARALATNLLFGWLSMIAGGVALLSYYAWITALELQLSWGWDIEIQSVGRLYYSHDRVRFAAAPELTGLLAANRQLVAFAH